MRTVSLPERRARLANRHNLAAPADDLLSLAGSLVGLHSSDPATVYLSARARLDSFRLGDLERVLYEDRTLARVLGMRRTLWVIPAESVPAVHNSSTVKLIAPEMKRTARMIEGAGIATNGAAWHEMVMAKTLAAMERRGSPAAAMELREDVPELKEQFINYRSDGSILGRTGLSTRVLFNLATRGDVIRAKPRGTWISGQYRWSTTLDWLGAPIPEVPRHEAQVEVLRSWLRGFGPGSENDIAWWTGWTRGDVRFALRQLEAVEVSIGDTTGHVLPDDLDEVEAPGPWAAFLPSLDPTTMGWKERDWYMGSHTPRIFDRNGNAGPTVWCDGKVVGGWSQRPDGAVTHELLEDVGSTAEAMIEARARELEAWLDGVVVTARFRTPLDLALSGPRAG